MSARAIVRSLWGCATIQQYPASGNVPEHLRPFVARAGHVLSAPVEWLCETKEGVAVLSAEDAVIFAADGSPRHRTLEEFSMDVTPAQLRDWIIEHTDPETRPFPLLRELDDAVMDDDLESAVSTAHDIAKADGRPEVLAEYKAMSAATYQKAQKSRKKPKSGKQKIALAIRRKKYKSNSGLKRQKAMYQRRFGAKLRTTSTRRNKIRPRRESMDIITGDESLLVGIAEVCRGHGFSGHAFVMEKDGVPELHIQTDLADNVLAFLDGEKRYREMVEQFYGNGRKLGIRLSESVDEADDSDPVVFRVWKSGSGKGDVIALLPGVEANPGRVMSYEHVGQHGEADPGIVDRLTRPATSEEYADLLAELKQRGYKPRVIKRLPPRSEWRSTQMQSEAVKDYGTNKSPKDSTFSSQWSGKTGAPQIKGKKCGKCGGKVFREGDSAYCPKCDDYVKTESLWEVDGEEDDTDRGEKVLDAGLTRVEKKGRSWWWIPGTDMAANQTLMGDINIWRFGFSYGTGVLKSDKSAFLVVPTWSSRGQEKLSGVPLNPGTAEKIVALFKANAKPIKEVMQSALLKSVAAAKDKGIEFTSAAMDTFLNALVKMAQTRMHADNVRYNGAWVDFATGKTTAKKSVYGESVDNDATEADMREAQEIITEKPGDAYKCKSGLPCKCRKCGKDIPLGASVIVDPKLKPGKKVAHTKCVEDIGEDLSEAKVKMECMECGKTFTTSNTNDPECPKCGSTDLEVAESDDNDLTGEPVNEARSSGINLASVQRAFSKIDDIQAKEVVGLVVRAGTGRSVENALEEINEIVEGYGVESINGDGPGGYWATSVLHYVNMGDTYNTTICYDTNKEQFFLGSWGDWVEKYGDKLHVESVNEEDDDEPGEDDITTEDDEKWFQYGKLYHRGDRKSLKAKMDRDNFWPNVFVISDHGNAHLISNKRNWWKESIDEADGQPINTKQPGDSGYVAFYKRKRVEVYGKTLLAARDVAQKYFKAKNGFDIAIKMAERDDGSTVTHTADESVDEADGQSISGVDYTNTNATRWMVTRDEGTDDTSYEEVDVLAVGSKAAVQKWAESKGFTLMDNSGSTAFGYDIAAGNGESILRVDPAPEHATFPASIMLAESTNEDNMNLDEAKFSKKHYVAIANIIAKQDITREKKKALAAEFSSFFADDNPAFRSEQFERAAIKQEDSADDADESLFDEDESIEEASALAGATYTGKGKPKMGEMVDALRALAKSGKPRAGEIEATLVVLGSSWGVWDNNGPLGDSPPTEDAPYIEFSLPAKAGPAEIEREAKKLAKWAVNPKSDWDESIEESHPAHARTLARAEKINVANVVDDEKVTLFTLAYAAGFFRQTGDVQRAKTMDAKIKAFYRKFPNLEDTDEEPEGRDKGVAAAKALSYESIEEGKGNGRSMRPGGIADLKKRRPDLRHVSDADALAMEDLTIAQEDFGRFTELAERFGAPQDAPVEVSGDSITVTLPAAVATKIKALL